MVKFIGGGWGRNLFLDIFVVCNVSYVMFYVCKWSVDVVRISTRTSLPNEGIPLTNRMYDVPRLRVLLLKKDSLVKKNQTKTKTKIRSNNLQTMSAHCLVFSVTFRSEGALNCGNGDSCIIHVRIYTEHCVVYVYKWHRVLSVYK